jgi:hypothetical protein
MSRTLSSDRSLLGGGFGLILSIPIEFTWTFSFSARALAIECSRVSPGFWYSDSRCLQTVWRLFKFAICVTANIGNTDIKKKKKIQKKIIAGCFTTVGLGCYHL